MLQLKGKRVAILGLASEGIAMVRALAEKGATVFGLGMGTPSQIAEVQEKLADVPCKLIWKPIPQGSLVKLDLVVDTPGSKVFRAARDIAQKQGIPVYSDLDLASEFNQGPMIGITGTNGKTTAMAVLFEMLVKQGYNVGMFGGDFLKLGDLIRYPQKLDFYLIELSSRRLEISQRFHPHIAILLNIFPAHGDRHAGGIPAYIEAKAKIFSQQTEADFLIHEASAKNIRELIRKKSPKARRLMFSMGSPVEGPGAYLEKKKIVFRNTTGKVESYGLEKAKLRLPTYLLSYLAAIPAARLSGVEPKNIQATLDQFGGLPHRLQFVRTLGEITFVDDSRSTNIGATAWALSTFSTPIIWITGGRIPKDARLEDMLWAVKGRIKLAICIGPKRKEWVEHMIPFVPAEEAASLKAAVQISHERAAAQDVVLFSPACPPDRALESSGRDRGKEFQQLVKQLKPIVRMARAKPTFVKL